MMRFLTRRINARTEARVAARFNAVHPLNAPHHPQIRQSFMPTNAPAIHADRLLMPRWQRLSTYATFALLLVTGVLWWWLDAERGDNPPNAPQAWCLRLHGLLAMLVLVCFGAALTAHVRIAWTLHRNRALGGALVTTVVVLMFTGYALYYALGDAPRALSSWIHFCFGIAAPAVLALHIVRGRAARRAGVAPAITQHTNHPSHLNAEINP